MFSLRALLGVDEHVEVPNQAAKVQVVATSDVLHAHDLAGCDENLYELFLPIYQYGAQFMRRLAQCPPKVEHWSRPVLDSRRACTERDSLASTDSELKEACLSKRATI